MGVGAFARTGNAFGACLTMARITDVKLSDLQNHFYTHLPAIRDRIFNALMSDGYYLHRPDTVKQGYIGAGLLIGVLLVGGAGYSSLTSRELRRATGSSRASPLAR